MGARGPMNDKTRPDETGFRFIGKPLPRKEDERLITGKGRFTDDFNLDGQAYAVDGALALSARAHCRDRRGAGEAMPGVLGVFTGADCVADKLDADPARSGAEDQIRHEAARPGRRRGVHRPAYAAAGGQGAPRRRGGRHGGGRDQGAGAGCRGSRRGAVRRAALRAALRRRDAAGRADAVGRGAEQRPRRHFVRRHAKRPTAPSRAPRTWSRKISTSAASPACRWSRAPRSATTTPRPAATRSMPAAAARCGRRTSLSTVLGIPPDTAARALVRCRRQFRHAQPPLCRVRPGAVGREKARPAGQIHRDALGSVPQRLSGPRSGHQGRACARCRRQIPRHARHQYQQCRRALRVAVAAEQGLRPDHRLV